ncbi:MAG: R3H domain-containing nucleic acid-binding protein [Patescibacteria group bacterium]|nr:R3H domain-containing nucleic acid-binding protein [Patescibacteria group bacterium]
MIMKPENIETLKNLIDETLRKMTFSDFSLGVREEAGPDGENVVFNIGTKESDLLIGQYGMNLRSLQHILRAMARKKTDDKLRFSVDVNDYRRQKIGLLTELARSLARQAIVDKRPVVLRPMGAYERRIVHMELSGNDQVKTESIGEGEERRVVIKPVGSIEQNDSAVEL